MGADTTTMGFNQAFDGDDGAWSFPISTGIWQHIVVVYDNDLSANAPVIYVDGSSVVVAQTTTKPFPDSGNATNGGYMTFQFSADAPTVTDPTAKTFASPVAEEPTSNLNVFVLSTLS